MISFTVEKTTSKSYSEHAFNLIKLKSKSDAPIELHIENVLEPKEMQNIVLKLSLTLYTKAPNDVTKNILYLSRRTNKGVVQLR